MRRFRQAEYAAELDVEFSGGRQSPGMRARVVFQYDPRDPAEIGIANIVVDGEEIVSGIRAHDTPGFVEGDEDVESDVWRPR